MCMGVCVSVMYALFNYCINMDFESVNKDLLYFYLGKMSFI